MRDKPSAFRVMLLFIVCMGYTGLTGCAFSYQKQAPDADQNKIFTPPTIEPIRPDITATAEGEDKSKEKIVCEDKLSFVEDLNYPDGMVVAPSATIEKQWKVKNIGVCNWNDGYKLKFIEGDAMGANPEQSLYPARSDTEFVIKIKFTAPAQPGNYRSIWQAQNPDGMLFGDPIYIDIIVSR